MTNTEIQNLILNVQGRDEVARLSAELQKEEETLRQTIALFGQASVQSEFFAKSTLKARQELEHAQKVVATTATNTRNYQQALMASSFALQDFMSANGGFAQQMMSVSNNIPTMLSGFQLSTAAIAGIGAAFTVIAVAAPQIAQAAKSMKLFGDEAKGAHDQLDLIKQRIEELEKKPVKLAVETAEIDAARIKLRQLEDAQRAHTASMEGKSIWEKEAGDQAKAFFDANGPEYKAAHKKMVDTRAGELAGTDKEFQAAFRDNQTAEQGIGDLEQQMKENPADAADLNAAIEVQRKIAAAAREKMAQRVQGLRGDAELSIGGLRAGVEKGNDPTARANLAGRLRQAGAGDLAGGIEGLDPDAIQADEEREREFERGNENWEWNAPIRRRNQLIREGEERRKIKAWNAAQPDPAARPAFRMVGGNPAAPGGGRGGAGGGGGIPQLGDNPDDFNAAERFGTGLSPDDLAAGGVARPTNRKGKVTIAEQKRIDAARRKRVKEEALAKRMLRSGRTSRGAHAAARGPQSEQERAGKGTGTGRQPGQSKVKEQAAAALREQRAYLELQGLHAEAMFEQMVGMFGQASQKLAKIQAQQQAAMQRQQQDGDSFLPATY
jgi:hypothetical protein